MKYKHLLGEVFSLWYRGISNNYVSAKGQLWSHIFFRRAYRTYPRSDATILFFFVCADDKFLIGESREEINEN
jgi:hypothetical protein